MSDLSSKSQNNSTLQPTCNQLATDTISRQALLAEYDRVHVGPPGGARKLIEDAPEVKPKVVAEIKIDGDTLRKLVNEAIEEIKAKLFGNSEQLDTISRQAAIDAYGDWYVEEGTEEGFIGTVKQLLEGLPSAQPEITDEQAIEHLQESGWMQNHDKQMYEMGLREQLADDSDSYDALLPSAQPEPISEEYARAVFTWLLDYQIKAAELEGRYTPYEVLSWVANDWRKENVFGGEK